jgi:hypothetical protein
VAVKNQTSDGKRFTVRYSKWFALIFLQFLLAGCAMSGQKWANQSFDFDTASESKDVNILDWQYGEHGYVGNEHQTLPRAPKDRVDKGLPIGGGGLSGGMPVGDYIYVKWRIKATGEIREDKVDLRSRLPNDMNNHGIHFIVKGAQLYIFLVPPMPPHTPPFDNQYEGGSSWPAYDYGRAIKKDPVYQKHINKMQIYPNIPMFNLEIGSEKYG